MGLDNGIYIENWDIMNEKGRIYNKFFEDCNIFPINNINVLEVAYWRNQYILRDIILNNFYYRDKCCINSLNGGCEEEYILNIDDIDVIINILNITLHKDFWIDNHFNTWVNYFCDEFKTYKKINKKYIKNLKLLKKYKMKYKDLKIVFYDSF